MNPPEGFQLPCSLSSHFCFLSLKDNIAHKNKMQMARRGGRKGLSGKTQV